MDQGHSLYLDLAHMRQAELLREAERDRLACSLGDGRPGLFSRLSRMLRGRQDGRSRPAARLNGERGLAS